MKRDLSISLRFDLAIGKVNLNEIVYRLKEIRDELMLRILAESGYPLHSSRPSTLRTPYLLSCYYLFKRSGFRYNSLLHETIKQLASVFR